MGPSQPAAAEVTALTSSSWAYTDLREPRKIHIDPAGDLPLGAWRDEIGRLHSARVYFTFDVHELAGRFIYDAVIGLTETVATTCEDRQVTAWHTDGVTNATSFADPPAQHSQLQPGEGHAATPCPAPFITWNATGALQDTVDAGDSTLTVELRVPSRYAFIPDLGRRLASEALLLVEYETLPLPRPVVSSPAYPEEPPEAVLGAGIPGEFTFDSRGITSTVGFQYVWNDVFSVGDPFTSNNFVLADEPGGSVTLMLAPPRAFQNNLRVRSVRADGLPGAIKDYRILVRDTAPLVTWDPEQVAVGVPFPITFTPVVNDAIEYVYRLEPASGSPGPEVTVPASPDGTATTMLTLPEPDLYRLHARSVHAAGWTSPESLFLVVAF